MHLKNARKTGSHHSRARSATRLGISASPRAIAWRSHMVSATLAQRGQTEDNSICGGARLFASTKLTRSGWSRMSITRSPLTWRAARRRWISSLSSWKSGRNLAVDEPESYSGGNRNLIQQTSEQCSQLIEVVGTSDIHVFSDRDFITLIDLCNAEDHDWHILSYCGKLADMTGDNNNFVR